MGTLTSKRLYRPLVVSDNFDMSGHVPECDQQHGVIKLEACPRRLLSFPGAIRCRHYGCMHLTLHVAPGVAGRIGR